MDAEDFFRAMVVMISGANRGIGEEIEKKLISEGYILSFCARKIESLQRKIESLQDKFSALEQHGRIDVLINNAGIPVWEHGIRATIICPGWVNTWMVENISRAH